MRNLRYALRTLFKTPFVTVIAVISLALGIGANSAIFSLFDQVLLSPLPVEAPARLVNLAAPGPKPGSQSCGNAGDCDTVFSYAMFRDLEAQQTSFTGIAAHRQFGAALTYLGQTTTGESLLVSGSYFPVLGLRPALGRLLGPGDDRTVGESHVAVLAYDAWRTRFGASADVLNHTMTVNGETMAIVGVAPEGFYGTTLGVRPKVYVPISLRGLMEPPFKDFDNRRSYWAYLFARLKPGVSIDQARTALNAPYHAIITSVEAPLQKGMSEATKGRFLARVVTLEQGSRGQSSLHQEARTPLVILLCVTGVVLLIACANIANLLLARAAGRATEMAVRLSLGASRRQLMGQLLTESCLLAVCGGAAGLLVARWTLGAMRLLVPDAAETIPFELNGAALVFALALSMATGLLFGLFPALHSTRPDLASTLKNQAGQPAGARSARWFRLTLATGQITLSMALLAMAGLFTKSLINVSRVDLGLKVDHLVTFSLAPRLSGYSPERTRLLFEQIEEAMAAVPGVTAATAAVVPLLAGDNYTNGLSVQGFQSGPDVNANASLNEVGPGFFRALGIPLLSGREFTRGDVVGSPKVAIVNDAFLKKFHLGRDAAVGTLMAVGAGNGVKLDIEIVGVVPDTAYSDVKAAVPPQYFVPYGQDEGIGFAHFYLQTALDPADIFRTIPGVVARFDPNLPLGELKTMPQQIRENVGGDRLISTLSAAFAAVATLLAAIGLYGVLAYTVSQRTREFGLRMALGADRRRVRSLVLGQVVWMTAIGGSIGLGIAVVLGQLAKSLLFRLEGYDPLVLTLSAVVLSLVALGAGFIPALRASRLDPMRALRYE